MLGTEEAEIRACWAISVQPESNQPDPTGHLSINETEVALVERVEMPRERVYTHLPGNIKTHCRTERDNHLLMRQRGWVEEFSPGNKSAERSSCRGRSGQKRESSAWGSQQDHSPLQGDKLQMEKEEQPPFWGTFFEQFDIQKDLVPPWLFIQALDTLLLVLPSRSCP